MPVRPAAFAVLRGGELAQDAAGLVHLLGLLGHLLKGQAFVGYLNQNYSAPLPNVTGFNYKEAIRGGAPVYIHAGDTVVVPD